MNTARGYEYTLKLGMHCTVLEKLLFNSDSVDKGSFESSEAGLSTICPMLTRQKFVLHCVSKRLDRRGSGAFGLTGGLEDGDSVAFPFCREN